MNLEDLIEILTVWNIANRNPKMVAMLEGEKSVEEYLDSVELRSQKHLEELTEKLEKERSKTAPNEAVIEIYNSGIRRANAMQERIALYQDKTRGE